MKRSLIALVVCSILLGGAAAQPARAAEINISIVFDNGAEGLDEGHARERNQLGGWMDDDLVRVFARYAKKGYEAQLIVKADEFKPEPGRYLLNVKITEYNAGNKAARMIVGFGAGGVSLKTQIELSDGSTALLAKEESCFSGREWRNAARKVNELIAASVTAAIEK